MDETRMNEIREELIKIRNKVRIISNKIQDILLSPGDLLTKGQEKQILKLRQERFKIRAKHYEKLQELLNTEEYNHKIKELKDEECKLFYLIQSKH